MHIVPDFPTSVYLIENTGTYWVYRNLTHAADELNRLHFFIPGRRYIGKFHREVISLFEWMDDCYRSEIINYQFILRGELGEVYTIEDLLAAKTPYVSRYTKRRAAVKNAEFRKDPVPGIGKYRRQANWLRRIHTTSERRMAEAHSDVEMKEYDVKVRAKRNARNLPDSWDDYRRHIEKNWKSQRKTQWKISK